MYHTWMVWTGTGNRPIGQLGKPLEIQPRWASKHGPKKSPFSTSELPKDTNFTTFGPLTNGEVGWFKLQSMFASCKPAPPPYICMYILYIHSSDPTGSVSFRTSSLVYHTSIKRTFGSWLVRPPTLDSPKSYPRFGVSERYKRLHVSSCNVYVSQKTTSFTGKN